MSRHKIVKNLDLDDELDDFDGGDDYDYDYGAEETGGDNSVVGELSEEDQRQMAAGTIAVRGALGADVPGVTDIDIQEALWHYYYDVEKTVEWLLELRTSREGNAVGGEARKEKKKKKKTGASGPGIREPREAWSRSRESLETCSSPFIPADFWNDMKWLNIPTERQTIFVEPLYPRGGLLGGSPDAAPKMSKLQALAAARKKKAQEQRSSASMDVEEKPMDELAIRPTSGNEGGRDLSGVAGSVARSSPRAYPVRKRKNSSSERKVSQPANLVEQLAPLPVEDKIQAPFVEQAKPSAFASIMFGNREQAPTHNSPRIIFTSLYSMNPAAHPADAFTGPSPDDIVLAAQSKAALSKSVKTPSKTTPEKTDQISNGVKAMGIEDSPKVASKNLDVLVEYGKTKAKNSANFVVIGHVDAGKSTLMGRLLYDLKVVDQRTIDKYRKEAEKMGKSSFALAWVLDQGTEERSRGVTIDIATNKFETSKTAFTILDAPGHRDFIPNMIAGASQADFAVLVIDASTGSFESGLRGQTKEHALLVRSMGVQRIIIAINKMDTVSWSQDRFVEISQQVSAFLAAAGFLSKNITFIPVSGLRGVNIVNHSTEPAASWYKGPTLVEELDNSEPVSRALDRPLRLTVGNIFRGGVQNPLSVSGRIEAGSLQSGDALIAEPSSQKCIVKSLEMDNDSVDWAVAGQNITIHLSGIDPAHLKIGDMLCRPGSEIKSVREIRIKVLAFEFLTPMAVDVHRGRLHVAGKIREVVALLDKGTGAVLKKRPKIVKPGSIARLVVELDMACPLETSQRVVLRSSGETVGAGLLE